MNNLPDPIKITRLIESDELIRYVVEQLGGRIIAVTDKHPDQPDIFAKSPTFSIPIP